MNCKCGGKPELQIDYHREENDYWFKCNKCGKESPKMWTQADAEKQWENTIRNFPTCDSCEHFVDTPDPHICTLHDRGTEDKWTCPDHMEICHEKEYAKAVTFGVIEEYTHTHNKNLLDTHFGDSASELLQGLTIRKEPDYKAEFLKLEKDYFEDVADLKQDLKTEQDKVTYWFEKHSEEQENSTYWYKEWQKASHENEKLNMLIAKIKEIVEG